MGMDGEELMIMHEGMLTRIGCTCMYGQGQYKESACNSAPIMSITSEQAVPCMRWIYLGWKSTVVNS